MQEKGFYPDYGSYSEEEFAADEFFQKWVLMPDEENIIFWEKFLEQNPDQRISVDNACKLVKHLTETGFHIPFLSVIEKQSIRSNIFESITRLDEPVLVEKKIFAKKWWFWVAAGVMLVFGFLFLTTFNSTKLTAGKIVKANTDFKQIKEILLPDGSTVVLNGNSSVEYKEAFNADATRDIYLVGNAYFRVKEQVGKQFIVHTPEVSVKVTGTEFNVNTRTSVTSVSLTHGSVDVGTEKNTTYQSIGSLLPGQTLKYNAANGEMVTGNVQTDLYTYAWDHQEWHFNNTPVQTVIELVEQFYGTEVVVNSKDLDVLTISAVISVRDYATLIKVIEKTLDVTVTETRNKVFIN